MIAILLSLATALGYTTHDTLMIPVLRETSVLASLLWIKLAALVLLLVALVAFGGLPAGHDGWHAAGFAAAGGIVEVASFGAFLTALARGKLSIVSPLSSLSGAFTALFVVALGGAIAPLAWVALPLAIVGGAFASVERRSSQSAAFAVIVAAPDAGPQQLATPPRRGVTAGAGWALVASLLFGLITICFGQAASLTPVAVAVVGCLASLVVIAPLAMLSGRWRVPRQWRARLGLCGVLDAISFLAFARATAIGPLPVVGVAVAQTGTMAVVVGMLLLKERPTRPQVIGVGFAIVAVSLLAAAS